MRKVRLLFKIWAFSIPGTIACFAFGIWKCIDPTLGGCPEDYVNSTTVLAPNCQDHVSGSVLIIIGIFVGIFLVYFPGYVAGYWEKPQ